MKNEKNKKPNFKRRYSRLAALQCLYQHESQPEVDFLRHLKKFEHHFFNKNKFVVYNYDHEIEGEFEADVSFTHELCEGVKDYQDKIDQIISDNLSEEWRIERLELVILITLRLAVYELYYCPDIPKRVTISEYVNLTATYYEEKEPAFVNRVLDTLPIEKE